MDGTQPGSGTQTATPHPFDIESIEKGDYIGPEVIEEAYGVKRDTVENKQAFDLKLLQARSYAERGLRRLGRPMTVKTEKDGLRFMVDAAASKYNDARMRSLWGQTRRALRRACEVDVDNLTDDEKRSHGRMVEISAARVAGATKAARKCMLKSSSERSTPRLGDAGKDTD